MAQKRRKNDGCIPEKEKGRTEERQKKEEIDGRKKEEGRKKKEEKNSPNDGRKRKKKEEEEEKAANEGAGKKEERRKEKAKRDTLDFHPLGYFSKHGGKNGNSAHEPTSALQKPPEIINEYPTSGFLKKLRKYLTKMNRSFRRLTEEKKECHGYVKKIRTALKKRDEEKKIWTSKKNWEAYLADFILANKAPEKRRKTVGKGGGGGGEGGGGKGGGKGGGGKGKGKGKKDSSINVEETVNHQPLPTVAAKRAAAMVKSPADAMIGIERLDLAAGLPPSEAAAGCPPVAGETLGKVAISLDEKARGSDWSQDKIATHYGSPPISFALPDPVSVFEYGTTDDDDEEKRSSSSSSLSENVQIWEPSAPNFIPSDSPFFFYGSGDSSLDSWAALGNA